MVGKIHFTIDKHGEIDLSVEGMAGSSCEEFTKPFEDILGTITKRNYKDSYFEKNIESEFTQEKNHG